MSCGPSVRKVIQIIMMHGKFLENVLSVPADMREWKSSFISADKEL